MRNKKKAEVNKVRQRKLRDKKNVRRPLRLSNAIYVNI